MPPRYSNPDRRPIQNQAADSLMRYAGQTATWSIYVSASAGIPAAYVDASACYRHQTITAIFGRGMLGQFPEYQVAAGMQAAGMMIMTSPYKIGRQDEIKFNGAVYRVEADPMPARMVGHYSVQLKRGEG